jgi:DNA-binding response OmpR family regulator
MDVVFFATGRSSEVFRTQLRSFPLLGHRVKLWSRPIRSLIGRPSTELLLIDGTQDVHAARRCCRDLASLSIAPPVVVILTESSVSALSPDWGVADFLLENYSLAEIHSRLVRAAMIARRRVSPTIRRYGSLTLDLDRLTLSVGDRSIALIRIEHALLALFFDNPETVQTRDAIRDQVWADSPAFASRNIDTFICRVRRKLGEHGAQIHTVRSVGYRSCAVSDARDDGLDPPQVA